MKDNTKKGNEGMYVEQTSSLMHTLPLFTNYVDRMVTIKIIKKLEARIKIVFSFNDRH